MWAGADRCDHIIQIHRAASYKYDTTTLFVVYSNMSNSYTCRARRTFEDAIAGTDKVCSFPSLWLSVVGASPQASSSQCPRPAPVAGLLARFDSRQPSKRWPNHSPKIYTIYYAIMWRLEPHQRWKAEGYDYRSRESRRRNLTVIPTCSRRRSTLRRMSSGGRVQQTRSCC